MIQIDQRIDEAQLRKFASQAPYLTPQARSFWEESFLWEEGEIFYHGVIVTLHFTFQICENGQKPFFAAGLAVVAAKMIEKGWW